jgi:hypothetical protein
MPRLDPTYDEEISMHIAATAAALLALTVAALRWRRAASTENPT